MQKELGSAEPSIDQTEPRSALRVVTWNLNHWRQSTLPTDTRRAAWDYLRALGSDVALVQEAVPPLDLPAERVAYGEIAGHRNWGSAVVALDPQLTLGTIRSVRIPWTRRRFLLANTHPGAVAVAELSLPAMQPITFVSIYGVMDGSSTSTMLRVAADLVPLFDSPQGARVILGGDFNVSRAAKDAKQVARAEAILTAFTSLGLVEAKGVVSERPLPDADCACGVRSGEDGRAPCDHIATWGTTELDYLFVSPGLAGQVTSLAADKSPVEAGVSDHVPLVLDLALTSERTAHGWDEESFAIEVGRRHGPAARQVVERLVNWADTKERELTAATGVATKVLTRFPTNGITTEPELMFPVDLNLEPRGSQPTISIHADGRVVVWLGAMRHPPFDTEAARHEIRQALNSIPGVHLPSRLVNGWPRFDLAVLEDPANLLRLVEVLDRIATTTGSASMIAG